MRNLIEIDHLRIVNEFIRVDLKEEIHRCSQTYSYLLLSAKAILRSNNKKQTEVL